MYLETEELGLARLLRVYGSACEVLESDGFRRLRAANGLRWLGNTRPACSRGRDAAFLSQASRRGRQPPSLPRAVSLRHDGHEEHTNLACRRIHAQFWTRRATTARSRCRGPRAGDAKSSPADPPDTPVGRPPGAVWPLGPRSGPLGCEYSTKPQGRVQGVSCIAPARGARALRDGCGDSHEGRKHPTGNTAWKHPDRIPLSLVNRAGQGPDRPHRRRTQSRLRRPGPSPIHREGRSRPSLRQRRPLRPLPRGWASPGPASPPFASQSSS
jgi:hypothetical protein